MSVQLGSDTEIDRPVEAEYADVPSMVPNVEREPRMITSPLVDGETGMEMTCRTSAEERQGTSETIIKCMESPPSTRFGSPTHSGMLGGRSTSGAANDFVRQDAHRTRIDGVGTVEVSSLPRRPNPVSAPLLRSTVDISLEHLKIQQEVPVETGGMGGKTCAID